MASGFQLLDSKSFSVELGSQIPIVSGISDSYSCIPDSKAQDSGFHRQKKFKIQDSTCKNFPDTGIRIPLPRARKRSIRTAKVEKLRKLTNLFVALRILQLWENHHARFFGKYV